MYPKVAIRSYFMCFIGMFLSGKMQKSLIDNQCVYLKNDINTLTVEATVPWFKFMLDLLYWHKNPFGFLVRILVTPFPLPICDSSSPQALLERVSNQYLMLKVMFSVTDLSQACTSYNRSKTSELLTNPNFLVFVLLAVQHV